MTTDFQIHSLSREPFQELFCLSDAELAARSVVRYTVDAYPGYPCRISLQHRPVGEEVLLLSFEHQTGKTPYQAAGPIFVGRDSEAANLHPNELPSMFYGRPISVRAYDRDDMMIGAEVVREDCLEAQIRKNFSNAEVAYQHLHFARQGCFACRVQRVDTSS